MGIIADAKAKIGQMVEGAADVAKTVALKTADGIAKASKLSPAQLKAIEESREKYLSAKPDANPTEFIEKLLGTIGIEAYQAYLPQIKQVYSPVEKSFEKFNAENRIAYFDITKWVFDKEENYIDKLVNVYHVLSEENCNIALIYNRKQTGCKVSSGNQFSNIVTN